MKNFKGIILSEIRVLVLVSLEMGISEVCGAVGVEIYFTSRVHRSPESELVRNILTATMEWVFLTDFSEWKNILPLSANRWGNAEDAAQFEKLETIRRAASP